MSEPITPRELALELGVPAKTIRDFLRGEYGLLTPRGLKRWELTGDQAATVRAHFAHSAN